MIRKLAALGATLLLLLAVVGFSGIVPKQTEPAQAWYYGNCYTKLDGTSWCFKWCTSRFETYYIQGCGTWVRFNQWYA